MTVIEKIIAAHAGKLTVKPNDIVWVNVDYRSARDFGGANVVDYLEKHFAEKPIDDIAKSFFTFDTNAPANTIGYANNQHRCRTFARKWGITLADVDSGIGTHIAIERAYVKPGQIAVGTDSHFNILASIGAFGQGMGDLDIAYLFHSGKTWFQVPSTVKLVVINTPPKSSTIKDITLYLMNILGTDRALGKCVEISGDYVNGLNLEERITLCSMATESGAITFFLPPSDYVSNYYMEQFGLTVEQISPNSDAKYDEVIEVDLSDVSPMAAMPGSPNNVKAIASLPRTPVDSVFVGSCTNGRLSDIHALCDVLMNGKVHDGVMLKVVPSTRQIYKAMLKDGSFESLIDAGAIISQPGCGGCASGQLGMTGKGEVQVSTSNRNFSGKQGSGHTYLVSPRTAGWTALRGYLCNED